jgi:hypothetical protein
MTMIATNGTTLQYSHVYRTANARALPKWQRNRGVVFLRQGPEMSGLPTAIVRPVGERSEFIIAADLLERVN